MDRRVSDDQRRPIRAGRMTRRDIRRRAFLRAWNSEDTWVALGDKLAAWGCWGVILLAAVLIAAGVLRGA